jgi:hypothetical protein
MHSNRANVTVASKHLQKEQLIDLIKYLDLAVSHLSSGIIEVINECENLLGMDKVRPIYNQSSEDWVGMISLLKEKLREKKY